mmetsp:Transcript_4511/g.7631  ORF Transcript_4511/g.7631 Transcript_4511/m.7631 type:complete len:165 (+) Transcript_4511:89-583(+)|eukprot:CAMPEP_0119108730 /NCGR_PEP_ID=MMETSP1180-20130426/15628_1 /TAXON_ID=3052 ORGANISM="Chlamydomonas cf sp, Strain CCMP681" /NCGR_SAMPLE_ID=MMETSP1180 /ASSEMBLY_ACC=CAM_ASM_000741 /LENGTH=164 /DNA_ID=CAMNT_0007094383 /DNA_START=79 /DNA_END=573 /DNA_ORIENTATION=-
MALTEVACSALKDASRILLFDDAGTVLASWPSTFQVKPAELKPLSQLFVDRDEAIKHGITMQDVRYEVHRHHPPLVYGRSMTGTPESSEGVAVCRVEAGPGGQPAYGLITYSMPNISARMVPMLQQFCEKHLSATAATEPKAATEPDTAAGTTTETDGLQAEGH